MPPTHCGVVNDMVHKIKLWHDKQKITINKAGCPVCLLKGYACINILTLARNKTCKRPHQTNFLASRVVANHKGNAL